MPTLRELVQQKIQNRYKTGGIGRIVSDLWLNSRFGQNISSVVRGPIFRTRVQAGVREVEPGFEAVRRFYEAQGLPFIRAEGRGFFAAVPVEERVEEIRPIEPIPPPPPPPIPPVEPIEVVPRPPTTITGEEVVYPPELVSVEIIPTTEPTYTPPPIKGAYEPLGGRFRVIGWNR